MSDDKFLKVTQRAYKFIKGFTINYFYEGLVELITNSDDAYDKGNITNKTIEIECDYKNKISIVRDNAIGLKGDDMEKCFLQIGEYTSTKDSRGFFSRGAKDITVLGNLTFESIKDDRYSKVRLNTLAEGNILVKDKKVCNEIRRKLKIKSNGLLVTIYHNSAINMDSPDFLINRFPKYYSMRKIFSDNDTKVTLKVENFDKYDGIYDLKYNFPDGEILLYLNYSLPSYPDAEVNFVLNRSEKDLYEDQYNNNKFSDFGVLICNNKSIHEISILDQQNYHYTDYKKYFGIINTTYLHKLMYDYDILGPTKANPSPIIDPSRMNGLNTKHPFYQELIKIPKDRLKLLLQEVDSKLNERIFYIDDINLLIDELNLVGSDIIESNDISSISRSKENKLIRGIESDRGLYVNVEKNFTNNLFKMDNDDIQENSRQFIDPMSKIFDIIGRGDEGKIITDDIAKEKLYKITDDPEISENKQIFIYDKVDINKDEKMESLNTSFIQNKNVFKIKFVDFNDDNKKYEIGYYDNSIVLKINVKFPTIKEIFNDKSSEEKFDNIEAVLILGGIISEALTRIQLSCYINKSYIVLNNDDSSENFNILFKNYDNYKNNIDKRVHKTINNLVQKIIKDQEKTKYQINNDIENILIDSSSSEEIDIDSSDLEIDPVDLTSYIKTNNIKQIYISEKIKSLGIQTFDNIIYKSTNSKNSILLYGIVNQDEMAIVKRHKGLIFIYWQKNTVNILENNVKILKSRKIKHIYSDDTVRLKLKKFGITCELIK